MNSTIMRRQTATIYWHIHNAFQHKSNLYVIGIYRGGLWEDGPIVKHHGIVPLDRPLLHEDNRVGEGMQGPRFSI